MAKKKAVKRKRLLIPKGTPHPGEHGMKFVDASLTEKGAEKISDNIQRRDHNAATLIQTVKKQYLVYSRHNRPPRISKRMPRISPKMPRLR